MTVVISIDDGAGISNDAWTIASVRKSMLGPYRNALVTGATSGIGRAIAVALAQAGLSVLAVGRDRDALDALQGECAAKPFALDVRDREALSRLMSDQAIDVLV